MLANKFWRWGFFATLFSPAIAFARGDSTSTLIEALVLVAILAIMAGIPLYKRMRT